MGYFTFFLIALCIVTAWANPDHLKTLKNTNTNPASQPTGYNYNAPSQQSPGGLPPSPAQPIKNQQFQPPQQYPQPQQAQPQPQYPGYPPYSPYPQQPPPQQQAYPYYAPPPQSQPQPESLQQPGSARGARLLSPAPPRTDPVPRSLAPSSPYNNLPNQIDNNYIPGSNAGPFAPIPKPKKPYNKKYPLTAPLIKFKIGVVSDSDNKKEPQENSEDKEDDGLKKSLLKEGSLFIQQNYEDPSKTNITVDWDTGKNYSINSGYTYAGKGPKLSTLNVFNGNLYTCDDKTGIVYELPLNETSEEIEPIPWVILADGNYTGGQGFKCEWATIKDGDLWIGGHGEEKYNETTGDLIDKDDNFVKRISTSGEVTHLDWTKNFNKMAEALDIHFPGYVLHESAGWSDVLQKWIFMPKKISTEKLDDESSKTAGSNMVVLADSEFGDIQVGSIGELSPTHGFASFKFIPGTGDQSIVAIKTVEDGETAETYIMAFDLRGNILLEETKFADEKYESIEFL